MKRPSQNLRRCSGIHLGPPKQVISGILGQGHTEIESIETNPDILKEIRTKPVSSRELGTLSDLRRISSHEIHIPLVEDQSHTETVEGRRTLNVHFLWLLLRKKSSLGCRCLQLPGRGYSSQLSIRSSAPHSIFVSLKWSKPAQSEVIHSVKGSASATVASLSQSSQVVSQASNRNDASSDPRREQPRGIQ
uniref:Uncharacterized protein n=1 Tax=Ditylenchus dipsaci TaxID=166011 RepID=A0A915DBE9_9BILA